MKILAIDPGNEQSAFVILEDGEPVAKGKVSNEMMREIVIAPVRQIGSRGACIDETVVEMIASYGMPVGREIFETCVWIGRYAEHTTRPARLIYRKDVKLHLCGSPRAKDSNIRQALIDRYGGKDKAIGNKKNPGPLYGVSKDIWAALALGVTFMDQQAKAVA